VKSGVLHPHIPIKRRNTLQFNDYITFISAITAIAALVIAVTTLYVTWRIPHQIMLYQRYADLMREYRET
jgi:hypothetical protein